MIATSNTITNICPCEPTYVEPHYKAQKKLLRNKQYYDQLRQRLGGQSIRELLNIMVPEVPIYPEPPIRVLPYYDVEKRLLYDKRYYDQLRQRLGGQSIRELLDICVPDKRGR